MCTTFCLRSSVIIFIVLLCTLPEYSFSAVVPEDVGKATEKGRVPDEILALLTQVILGISLATSAVPQSVLSVQDRGSEVIGVLIVLIITAFSALPIREAFGQHDLSPTQFILVVLTPLVSRLDLALLIWVNVNKALIWAEPMLYTTRSEVMVTELLRMASSVWHNGGDHIGDVEFGSVGGEAAVLMHRLHHMYHPRNADKNAVLWLSHLTLWPVALVFHGMLQVLSALGFAIFYITAYLTYTCMNVTSSTDNLLKMRGSFFAFLRRSRHAQSQKMFMMREAATLFDSNQNDLTSGKRSLRHLWAMIATVDAMLRNQHYCKLFDIAYPMRAPLVLQRANATKTRQDIFLLLNKQQVFFDMLPDAPIMKVGEKISRQVILYRLIAWPSPSEYARSCLNRLKAFVDINTTYWKETESRLTSAAALDEHDFGKAKSEFIALRDVVRRLLVQLIMLAFCDGLGECHLSGEENIGADLATYFLMPKYMGLEMTIRLVSENPPWSNEEMGNQNLELNMLASLAHKLGRCECQICREITKNRRLPLSRYSARPNVAQLEEELKEANCLKASSIACGWKQAALSWTKAIFDEEEQVTSSYLSQKSISS